MGAILVKFHDNLTVHQKEYIEALFPAIKMMFMYIGGFFTGYYTHNYWIHIPYI